MSRKRFEKTDSAKSVWWVGRSCVTVGTDLEERFRRINPSTGVAAAQLNAVRT